MHMYEEAVGVPNNQSELSFGLAGAVAYDGASRAATSQRMSRFASKRSENRVPAPPGQLLIHTFIYFFLFFCTAI